MAIFDLFRPKWKNSSWAVRCNAVQQLSDQTLLATIATTDIDYRVRLYAVGMLSDQALLATLASSDKDWKIRRCACERLGMKQAALAEAAKNSLDRKDRWVAASELTDQTLLADIARNDDDSFVRRPAVYRVTDQVVLADIARNDKDSGVRRVALLRLEDRALQADIARNDTWQNRMALYESFGNQQAALAELVKNDGESASKVRTISDPAILADIAINATTRASRAAAVKMLTEQHLLGHVLESSTDPEIVLLCARQLKGKEFTPTTNLAMVYLALFGKAEDCDRLSLPISRAENITEVLLYAAPNSYRWSNCNCECIERILTLLLNDPNIHVDRSTLKEIVNIRNAEAFVTTGYQSSPTDREEAPHPVSYSEVVYRFDALRALAKGKLVEHGG